jgi:hypothetical protein
MTLSPSMRHQSLCVGSGMEVKRKGDCVRRRYLTLKATTVSTASLTLPITGHYCIYSANRISPLMSWAVYQCGEVPTQILLKMDTNPNAVDRDGLTTLHWAAFTGNKGASCSSSRQARTFKRRTKMVLRPRKSRPSTIAKMSGIQWSRSWDLSLMGRGCANRSARYVVVLGLIAFLA